MEDFVKFLLIAGVILVGILKEVSKNKKPKKATNNAPIPPKQQRPVETIPGDVPMPENWGMPRPLDELFPPKPFGQPVPKQPSKQKSTEKKRKKEEVSVAASLASSAAQDDRNKIQSPHYNTHPESANNDQDFSIQSAEEARRAIILGEILQRKY